jgi:GT2 family glycosyltransferase
LDANSHTDLSIVIVNYKTPRLTDICIGSILQKTKGCSFEIIVVDNDSQDESEQLIKSKYSGVNWVNSGFNAGTSIAYNIGVKASKGKYIIILNSDTEFRDDAISFSLQEYKLLEKKYDKVGLFSCQLIGYDDIIQFNSNTIFPTIQKYWRANPVNILLNISQQKITEEEKHRLHLSSHETKWIGIAFGIFNGDICRKENLYFDEDIFMYSDEVEWCHRLTEHGYRHFFSSSATILHLNGGSSVFSEWRHGQIVLSEWLYFMKVKGKAYFVFCIIQILLNHFLDSLFFIKQLLLQKTTENDLSSLKTRKLEISIIKRYFLKILLQYSQSPSSAKGFLKYEILQK